MGEIRKVKGNQIPHGTALAVLVAAEGQCGHPECDSWKTVGLDLDMLSEDGESTLRYVICLKHVGDFIQDMFLSTDGLIEASEDCGDPDCPVHGDDADDDEEYDD